MKATKKTLILLFIILSMKAAGLVAQNDSLSITLDTERFTQPHISISPDGKQLLFDVLGDLYRVPTTGGRAQKVLEDQAWMSHAVWAPDAKRFAFWSDYNGSPGIYLSDSLGSAPKLWYKADVLFRPMTAQWRANGDVLLQEGRQLYQVSSEGKKQAVPLANSIQQDQPRSFAVVGKHLYSLGEHLMRQDLKSGRVEKLQKIPKANQLRVNPQQTHYAYLRAIPKKRGYFELWLATLHTAEKQKIATLQAEPMTFPSYNFAPNGELFFVQHGNIKAYALRDDRVHTIPISLNSKKTILAPLQPEPRTIGDRVKLSATRWPQWASTSSTLYFGRLGKIYKQAKGKQATSFIAPENALVYGPALSPDEKQLVYTSLNKEKNGKGHLMLSPVDGGKPQQLTQKPGRYLNPSWSADGKHLVFIADTNPTGVPTHKASSTNWELKICVLELASGRIDTLRSVFPHDPSPERFYPTPVFAADRKSVYVNTYAETTSAEQGAMLYQVAVNKGAILKRWKLPSVDEARVSPDGETLAMIVQKKLLLAKFEPDTALQITDTIATPEGIPAYLQWNTNKSLVWEEGPGARIWNDKAHNVYRATGLSVPRPKPHSTYAIINAHILPMDKSGSIAKGYVLVEENRIKKVGKMKEIKLPNAMPRLDVQGASLLPGMIDTHAHVAHYPRALMGIPHPFLDGFLSFGITTLFDPSSNTAIARGYAELEKTGQFLAPRLYSSGPPLMGRPRRTEYSLIPSLKAAQQLVRAYKKRGFFVLKEYDQLNRYARQRLRKAAKQEGMGIVSHVSVGVVQKLSRVVEGVGGLEHEISNSPLYKDVAQFMGQSGVVYTPTLMVSPGGLFQAYPNSLKTYRKKLLRWNDRHKVNKWSENPYPQAYDSMLKAGRKRAARTLAKLVKEGTLLSTGAHGNGPPGLATHWEMWGMTYDDGIQNWEALRAATYNGAVKLGLADELGSIREGKLADMIIVGGNPIQDIKNSANVLYVIKNGEVYHADTLKPVAMEATK